MNELTIPSNKEQVVAFKQSLKDEIINGNVNPLQALMKLKLVEKMIDVLKDREVEETILKEAEKYHKEELATLYGCKFEIKETGVKYDYSQCGDTILLELEEKKKALEEEIKRRQEFLKAVPTDTETYGSDGIALSRPEKSSTTKVIITI